MSAAAKRLLLIFSILFTLAFSAKRTYEQVGNNDESDDDLESSESIESPESASIGAEDIDNWVIGQDAECHLSVLERISKLLTVNDQNSVATLIMKRHLLKFVDLDPLNQHMYEVVYNYLLKTNANIGLMDLINAERFLYSYEQQFLGNKLNAGLSDAFKSIFKKVPFKQKDFERCLFKVVLDESKNGLLWGSYKIVELFTENVNSDLTWFLAHRENAGLKEALCDISTCNSIFDRKMKLASLIKRFPRVFISVEFEDIFAKDDILICIEKYLTRLKGRKPIEMHDMAFVYLAGELLRHKPDYLDTECAKWNSDLATAKGDNVLFLGYRWIYLANIACALNVGKEKLDSLLQSESLKAQVAIGLAFINVPRMMVQGYSNALKSPVNVEKIMCDKEEISKMQLSFEARMSLIMSDTTIWADTGIQVCRRFNELTNEQEKRDLAEMCYKCMWPKSVPNAVKYDLNYIGPLEKAFQYHESHLPIRNQGLSHMFKSLLLANSVRFAVQPGDHLAKLLLFITFGEGGLSSWEPEWRLELLRMNVPHTEIGNTLVFLNKVYPGIIELAKEATKEKDIQQRKTKLFSMVRQYYGGDSKGLCDPSLFGMNSSQNFGNND